RSPRRREREGDDHVRLGDPRGHRGQGHAYERDPDQKSQREHPWLVNQVQDGQARRNQTYPDVSYGEVQEGDGQAKLNDSELSLRDWDSLGIGPERTELVPPGAHRGQAEGSGGHQDHGIDELERPATGHGGPSLGWRPPPPHRTTTIFPPASFA